MLEEMENQHTVFDTSKYSLYLISTLRNISMPAFLLFSGFKLWGQNALLPEQTPSLNIDHFMFQLFHIYTTFR
jgi:hypothetical protein